MTLARVAYLALMMFVLLSSMAKSDLKHATRKPGVELPPVVVPIAPANPYSRRVRRRFAVAN